MSRGYHIDMVDYMEIKYSIGDCWLVIDEGEFRAALSWCPRLSY